MNALSIVDKSLTMSSLEISELTGKRHDHVIRDIRAMLDALKDAPDLGHVREDKDARGYTAMLHLDRELTDTLLTGYSVPMRRKVVARWHELEAKAKPASLSRMDILKLAMESEEARIKAEVERDEAIRTKAQIGSRREATAMATAAAAKREVARLKDQLGFSARHATILQVEDAAGENYGFVPLRRWCKAHEVTPETVPDKRYPKGVKAWPAAAWKDVYGVDLDALFAKDTGAGV